MTLSPSSSAVELMAMAMSSSGLGLPSWSLSDEENTSLTRILFCVSVPVLSVHIMVTAPMVSDACSLRTRLLLLSIRRMLRANARFTAMGRPSGTAITMSVTAIMK